MSELRLAGAAEPNVAAKSLRRIPAAVALLRGVARILRSSSPHERSNQDTERALTVLLADLSERQREIHARLEQESRSHLTYITVLVGTIGTIAAADRWATSLSAEVQAFVPSMTLMLATILLFLPIDAMHQYLNFRVLALYITEQVVPQIRDMVALDTSNSHSGSARLQLMTWEAFRTERILRVRLSNALMNATVVLRAVSLYIPAAITSAFYLVATDKFASVEAGIMESILLLCLTIGFILPVALFAQLSGSSDLQLK